MYESYGDALVYNNSLLATLRTVISPKVTNELKVQHLYIRGKRAQQAIAQ